MSTSSQSKAELKALTKEQKKAAKAERREQTRGHGLWKMLGTGSALAAGVLTAKALEATWKTATGRHSPTRPDNPDIASREALAWAALSGMAIGVAKTYATRRAAKYWVKSTGRLPPGMSENAAQQVLTKNA